MDPYRFDSLAKRLGTRLSRRAALRAGMGASLGAVAVANLTPAIAQDAGTTSKDRYITIRSYPYTGPIDLAKAGLKGVIPVLYEQPGFISIHFVEGDDTIHLVVMFLDQTTADAGAETLDAWIGAHAQAVLRGDPQVVSGGVFLRSELHAGCPCTTGTDDACNSDRLICCGASDAEAGPGFCMTTATTCPGSAEEGDANDDSGNGETATPTVTAAADTNCTSAGCACIAGTDGACDDGLQCCGSGELGGIGICQSDCSGICTSEGCGCVAGNAGSCDDGLQCCSTGGPGSIGACFASCGGNTGCTSDGCACQDESGCDDGLTCCGAEPGAEGICQISCESVGICPGGTGCDCTDGVDGTCNGGLVCCASEPGGAGICASACA